MKKQIVRILGVVFIPMGTLLINACGPEGMTDSPVALDEASDNWTFYNGAYSEYGHCNNAVDDNGNGLVDGVDPDCHINPGPLRDLSIYDFPAGHNYFPDVRMDIPGGPGYKGSFRDPRLITSWFRFLTEPDGYVAGVNVLGIGANPEIVPAPMPIPELVHQGNNHPGNNNNLSLRALHVWDMFHPMMPGPAMLAGEKAPGVSTSVADAAPAPAGAQKIKNSTAYKPQVYTTASGIPGGWPGDFYRAQGPFSGNGSQGAQKAARTGNPDK